jgi:hypothetical protein
MTFHTTQNQANVLVVKAGVIIGYVSQRTTSIGAAKLAGTPGAEWSTRCLPDRSYSPGWIAR